jgi:hypothetical protein
MPPWRKANVPRETPLWRKAPPGWPAETAAECRGAGPFGKQEAPQNQIIPHRKRARLNIRHNPKAVELRQGARIIERSK